jgi:hypothetical protein
MTTTPVPATRPVVRRAAARTTVSAKPPAAATTPSPAQADRGRVLALLAPLLLFAHGIVAWATGVGAPAHAEGLAASGLTTSGQATPDPATPDALTGLTLVAAVAALTWLTAALGDRLEHLDVRVPTTVMAAFGAGATGSVWLGTTTGVLDGSLPSALTLGGPVLVGLGLAVVLAALVVEGRLPFTSALLAAGAGVVLALPWGLEPLGALLLLVALGPLTRPLHGSGTTAAPAS